MSELPLFAFGTAEMDAHLDELDEMVAGSVRYTSEPQALRFTVLGHPSPAGSKTSGVAYRKGPDGKPVPVTKNGKIVTFTKDSSGQAGKDWRQTVASTGFAARASSPFGDVELDGPLVVEMTFFRPRLASHFGTGRNAGVLKPSAPAAPDTRPDVLKLARAVEDALTSILWTDDARIVDERLRKVWGSPERVEIMVRPL